MSTTIDRTDGSYVVTLSKKAARFREYLPVVAGLRRALVAAGLEPFQIKLHDLRLLPVRKKKQGENVKFDFELRGRICVQS